MPRVQIKMHARVVARASGDGDWLSLNRRIKSWDPSTWFDSRFVMCSLRFPTRMCTCPSFAFSIRGHPLPLLRHHTITPSVASWHGMHDHIDSFASKPFKWMLPCASEAEMNECTREGVVIDYLIIANRIIAFVCAYDDASFNNH